MRRILGVVLAFAVLVPAAARAADANAIAQVKEQLAGIEAPVQFDAIKKIAGAEEALRDIASDAKLPPTTRAKALVALKEFPTDATLAFLTGILADPKAHESLRTRAPVAIAEGFKDKGLPALKPGLADSNKFVRKAVAQAVAKVPSPEALALLKERKAIETEPVVKKTLEELTAGK